MFGLGANDANLLALSLVKLSQHSLFKHLDVAIDHRERRAKLVRGCGYKLGLHLVVLFQLVVSVLQLDIRVPQLFFETGKLCDIFHEDHNLVCALRFLFQWVNFIKIEHASRIAELIAVKGNAGEEDLSDLVVDFGLLNQHLGNYSGETLAQYILLSLRDGFCIIISVGIKDFKALIYN